MRATSPDLAQVSALAYGANTLGAVAGVLAWLHLIMPIVGLDGAALVAAALDARQGTMIEGHPYHRASSRGERIDMILSRDGRSHRARPVSIRRVLDEAARDGRLPNDSDAHEAALTLASPLLVQHVMLRAPIDDRLIEQVLHAFLAELGA